MATAVSTSGTPVMSRITISDLGLDDTLEQRLIHLLGARGVQAADDRQGEDAVPHLEDRRFEFVNGLALLRDRALPVVPGWSFPSLGAS